MKSDHQLIEEVRSGSEYSFVILYERYKNAIFQFCIKMLRDEETAKDIFQDVFICVYEKIGDLKNSDFFKSWLYTIARNKCLTQIKKNKRFSEKLPEYFPTSDEDPLADLIEKENTNSITTALESLSSDYKEILILREYNEFSYQEIAQILNISESAVKSKIFKARLKLYEKIKNSVEYETN